MHFTCKGAPDPFTALLHRNISNVVRRLQIKKDVAILTTSFYIETILEVPYSQNEL